MSKGQLAIKERLTKTVYCTVQKYCAIKASSAILPDSKSQKMHLRLCLEGHGLEQLFWWKA